MHRKELNERSPLRLLERSIHGGLGRGNLGVVVARAGMGKTALLVGIALDDLMRGRKVLHVSLDEPVDRVREFYDEIFHDLVSSVELEDPEEARQEVARNRNIHTYAGNTFSMDKLRLTLGFLRDHADFVPAAIIVEGYDFTRANSESLAPLRHIARDFGVEVWMSAVTHRHSPLDDRGIPEPVAHVESVFSVVLSMAEEGAAVHLRILKDHDNPAVSESHVALDPTTMLLVQD